MATITAKNIGRINVWPTYAVAQEADTAESKFTGQLTVWRTNEEAKANISHEEGGGGGGAPDWVPANAKIHIDLVGGTPQGRAWVAGTGEVAVDTLLGSDPDSSNAWDPTGYDAGDLTENGYLSTVAVALIGSARTLALAGATIRFQVKHNNDIQPTQFAAVSSAGGAGVSVILYWDVPNFKRLRVQSWNGFDTSLNNVSNNGSGVNLFNTIAITMTTMRLEAAANGSAVVAGALVPGVDFPEGDEMAIFIVDPANTAALQSITLYDPLSSTAGLSELSEV